MTNDRGFMPPGDRGFAAPVDRGFAQPGDRGFAPPGDRGFAQPGDRGFAPPGDRGFAPPRQPQYIRCGQCNVLQPLGSAGPARCVSCGARIQRWVAHPPPGNGPVQDRPVPRRERPYAGPPSYRGGHPRWSFPPVVWRELPPPDPQHPARDPVPGLRIASWLAAATAVCALAAAAAESWRFALMLEGRTLVLSGDVVRASDVLVAASGLAVVLAALLTIVVAVPALLRAHVAAARRLGREPSRSARGIIARLLVPLWNVYGAGQIVTEIDGMLSAAAAGDAREGARPRASRVTAAWWLSWIVSSALMIATLARGFGGSLQAIADTVQLHICVDLAAAVVAGLGAVMLHRFARLLTGPKSEFAGWVVKPPEPTRPLAADLHKAAAASAAEPAAHPAVPVAEPKAVAESVPR